MYPSDRRYTKDHEWIIVTGNLGRVGITDYAQKQLGDVVFVELPDVGRAVSQGEAAGTIESVKAVSELYSPASGKVVAVNPELARKARTGQQRSAWHLAVRHRAEQCPARSTICSIMISTRNS